MAWPVLAGVKVTVNVIDGCGNNVFTAWAVDVLAPGNRVGVGVMVRVGNGVRVGAGVGERKT